MIKSKDITTIIISFILAIILLIFSKSFNWLEILNWNNLTLIWIIIFILFLIIMISISIIYMRIKESEIELIKQSTGQKKLEEKLKIFERLNKLEIEIENLKNEKRK